MPKISLYEYVADIRASIVIAAPSEEVAKAKIMDWSAEQWLANGETIGVNDVDLLDVREVECGAIDDVAHINATEEAAPCRE